MPSLSIIIVNYKSWEILAKNLELLTISKLEQFEIQIIVVDNCSNDGKLPEFVQRFPKVQFIENEDNWGFAHGCNLGAKHSRGEILLFLNPDTLAPKESLEKMYLAYMANPSIGILSCKQSDRPSSYQKIAPNIFTLFGLQRSLYKLFFYRKFKKTNCETCNKEAVSPDWISGSVVMISRAWFDRVGAWNTDYWMYSEDVELSKKVKDAGGKLYLLCTTSIVHAHGGASRINVQTAALTKAEVVISQHVYVKNNFFGFSKILVHFLLITNVLCFNGVLGFFGVLLFFIPKARVQFLILKNLLVYYISVARNQTWLSPRSFKFRGNVE